MRIGTHKLVILLSSVLFFSPNVFAADHEDGPHVKVDDNLQADILDFFVFPTLDNKRLALAMTLYSDAAEDAEFGANVSYRFRLRQGDVVAEGAGPTRRVKLSAGEEEDVIACRAKRTSGGEEKMLCELNPASCGDECLMSEVAVNAIASENRDGLRVFAGLVRDPFFSNVFRAREKRPRDHSLKAETPAANSLTERLTKLLTYLFPGRFTNPFETRSALAVVVEVPLTALESEPGILATTAETILFDDTQENQAHRIDRMGNVEVTNFLLCFRPIEILGIPLGVNQIDFLCPEENEGVKDTYNSEDAFDVSSGHKDQYERWFTTGLEPRRVFRRLFRLSHAAMAGSSSMA